MDDVLGVWSLVAPFLSGLFGFRNGWLVPVSVVVGTLIAQPLGGVEWWSFRNNEGPLILLFGLPVCGFSYLIGLAVGLAVRAKAQSR